MSNLLTSAAANTSTTTIFNIKVGYFGICGPLNNGVLCGRDVLGLQSVQNSTETPFALVPLAQAFRTQVLFPYLSILSTILVLIVTGILSTFPGWREEVDENGEESDVKPFPSAVALQTAFLLQVAASILAILSIVWQHVATVSYGAAIDILGVGLLTTEVGTAATVLGWVGACMITVGALGLWLLVLSLKIVADLIDGEDTANVQNGIGDE